LDPLAWTNCVFDWTRASDADGKTEVCLGLHSASVDVPKRQHQGPWHRQLAGWRG